MLKARAISSVYWSGADIFLRQGIQFVVSVVLARLLTPDDFGTVALLYLFSGIANAFVDSGFSTALIQRQDISAVDESTVFWFNLSMGLLVALALWSFAPIISHFYSLPILIPLTAVMALNVLLSAAGSIHSTLLIKHLDFRTQTKVTAVANSLAGGTAIVMGLEGLGVWALAAQILLATGLSTVMLWTFNRWRPTLVFSRDSARRLFGFGGYLLGSALLEITYTRAYTLLIGKWYGVGELGFYSRADSAVQLPVGSLSGLLARVAFPLFSSAAANKEQLRRGVEVAVRGIMLINIPMMVGMAAVARPMVMALFGDRWLPAVPILRILAMAWVFWPLQVINLNVLIAQGHSHLFFRLEALKKVIGVCLLLLGTVYGVLGIAWSQVAYGLVGFAINAHYTEKYLEYGVRQQARDVMPTLAIASFMGLAIYAFDAQIQLGSALQLPTLVLIGMAVFIGLGSLFQLTALQDSIALFRQHRASKHQMKRIL